MMQRDIEEFTLFVQEVDNIYHTLLTFAVEHLYLNVMNTDGNTPLLIL